MKRHDDRHFLYRAPNSAGIQIPTVIIHHMDPESEKAIRFWEKVLMVLVPITILMLVYSGYRGLSDAIEKADWERKKASQAEVIDKP